MSSALIETPIGLIGIHWLGDVLTGVDLDPAPSATDRASPEALSDRPSMGHARFGILDAQDESEAPPAAITRQLADYFEQATAILDLPLALAGTPFQQRVWALLRTIPAGRTRTYGEVARELGSAARAVGQACRANPCPIVVPCHRVVASQGLGGFAGDTSGRKLAVKRWLLDHEGAAYVV